jgi:hypothetical protein
MSIAAQAKRRRTQARNRRLGSKTGRVFRRRTTKNLK